MFRYKELIKKSNITKTSKGVALTKRLQDLILCKLLITIYKAIIRTHLDSGDILFNYHL